MSFAVYSKKKFEYELSRIRKENGIGGWIDITERVAELSDGEIYEYVYAIPTNINKLNVVIYSSVDFETDVTREIGSDAVRVILLWETKNGILVNHVKKHLRIETLFSNLERTIVDNVYFTKQKLYSIKWYNTANISIAQ